MQVKCEKFDCPLDLKVPYDWAKLSSSKTIEYLSENINCPDEAAIRSWVMSLKYTHPTYGISQKLERDAAAREVRDHINSILNERKIAIADAQFMLIGANNCYELHSFPGGWRPYNVHALDPAQQALAVARAEFDGINTYRGLIEQKEPFRSDAGKQLPDNSIDVCIAFRSLQSSKLSLWAALGKIRDRILKPNGTLLISLPKVTINYLGNRMRGVIKEGSLDVDFSKDAAEHIAKELTALNSNYYTNVRLFYGGDTSIEYYIVAQAT